MAPRIWRPVLRAAAFATAAYGILVFVVRPLSGHFSGDFEDFNAYWGAAQASLTHQDIYAPFTQQTQNVALSGFDYPPIVALLLTPIALMPFHAAATLWLLLQVSALLTGCIVAARTVLPSHWPRLELAVLCTFLFAPAVYNLWLGQMNPVVFLLVALALRSWMQGREVSCGSFIGAAAAIKLAPIVLLVLFLRRRWWRGALAGTAVMALAAGGGVLAFGVHTSLEYVRSVIPVLSRDDGWLYNQSWAGVINRLAAHSVLTFQPGIVWIRVIELALSTAGVAVAAWSVRPGHDDSTHRAAQFGAGILAMLLAGSITWYSHDVHLLIPLAASAVLATRITSQRRMLLAAVLTALAVTAVVARVLIDMATMQKIVAVSQTPFWWPLLQISSLPALSAAVLLAATVLGLRDASDMNPQSAARFRRAPAGARWRAMHAGHIASDQA